MRQWAEMLAATGQRMKAIAVYREIVRQRPDDYRAWQDLGVGLCMSERVEEGMEAFDRAIALAPHDPRPLNHKAVTYARLGRPEHGLPLLERALRVAPEDPSTHKHRGAVLERLGRVDEAIASYQRARELPEAVVLEALLHRHEGDDVTAEALLRAMLEERPDANPRDREMARRILAELRAARGR